MYKKVKAQVVEIIEQVERVYTIVLRPSKTVRYLPGQFLHLSLDSDYDGIGQWPESRCFSMHSSPSEKDIKITYAVKGWYTAKMAETLKPGVFVWIKLPYGELFSQHHNKINTVFIAGGTGITPFLSLFTDQSFNEYSHPRVYLGFRNQKHNLYLSEMSRLQNSTAQIVIQYQDTDGVLDISRIFSQSGIVATYFISGPPEMIKTFKQFLVGNGVPLHQICTDDWE